MIDIIGESIRIDISTTHALCRSLPREGDATASWLSILGPNSNKARYFDRDVSTYKDAIIDGPTIAKLVVRDDTIVVVAMDSRYINGLGRTKLCIGDGADELIVVIDLILGQSRERFSQYILFGKSKEECATERTAIGWLEEHLGDRVRSMSGEGLFDTKVINVIEASIIGREVIDAKAIRTCGFRKGVELKFDILAWDMVSLKIGYHLCLRLN